MQKDEHHYLVPADTGNDYTRLGQWLVPEEAVNAPSVRCGSECLDLELFKVACLH